MRRVAFLLGEVERNARETAKMTENASSPDPEGR